MICQPVSRSIAVYCNGSVNSDSEYWRFPEFNPLVGDRLATQIDRLSWGKTQGSWGRSALSDLKKTKQEHHDF